MKTVGITALFFSFSVHALQGYVVAEQGLARISGFSQIPKGGEIGSSSTDRPAFNETHIYHDNIYTLGFGFYHQDYSATFLCHHYNAHQKGILKHDIITHNQFISHGKIFDMQARYDWYEFEISKNFTNLSKQWTLSPSLSLNLLKYHYEFFAYPLASGRSFNLVSSSIGLKLQYYFTSRLFADANASYTLPLTHLSLADGTMGINYKILFPHDFYFIPRLSLGMLKMCYKDEQTLPNHIQYAAFPYLALGFQIEF